MNTDNQHNIIRVEFGHRIVLNHKALAAVMVHADVDVFVQSSDFSLITVK